MSWPSTRLPLPAEPGPVDQDRLVQGARFPDGLVFFGRSGWKENPVPEKPYTLFGRQQSSGNVGQESRARYQETKE